MRIRFGAFTLDIETRQLTRESVVIHLAPKAFELLVTLISSRPKALSKADLQQCLWPDTFVAEANVSNLVAELRHVLGDMRRNPTWIRTVHGFGYAFCGEAVALAAPPKSVLGGPRCWLEWGAQRFLLAPGEHVIGRDPDVEIRLDASTVSRRHAKVTVASGDTWLEDFGSKNGTQRGGERVAAPVQLLDGDVIHIGSVVLTFHLAEPVVSTDTLVGAMP